MKSATTHSELAERPCTRCREQFQPKRSEQYLCDDCREHLRSAPHDRAGLNAVLGDRLRARRRG